MPTTRLTAAAALLALAATALTVSCSRPDAPAALSGAPRGIVIDRDGVVEVLDGTTGPAHPVAGEPLGGVAADPLSLSQVRQPASDTVAGLRDGKLIALDPAHPGTPRTIAPAGDWFPDAASTGAWTVTQSPDLGVCPAIPGTSAGTVRYRVEHFRLRDGAVLDAARYLPCRQRPAADTAAGLLVETLHPQAEPSGNGSTVLADVQLIDRKDLRTLRTVQADATLLDAAGETVLAFQQKCDRSDCVKAIGLTSGNQPKIGPLPNGGFLAGAGIMDLSGRYFASAAVSPDGSLNLVVCDLKSGTVRTLGTYASLIPGAPRDIEEDMPSAWSGSRLITANPQDGTLATYDAVSGRTETRSGLSTEGNLQVWGAQG
ncbi:hypothetical protein ACIQGZ_26055 [Streptomyces sp. NPDC092296]|uniref:hypothetical protein n=1 Tax=Streptomyces sp. NPDC092296 TaxID=3366012 RepID=UPI0037F552F3